MYREMIEGVVPLVIDFLFGKNQSTEEDIRLQGLKPIVPTSKVWQFRSFLNLFEALLLNGETRESLAEKEAEQAAHTRVQKSDFKESVNKDDEMDSNDESRQASSPTRKQRQQYFDVVEPSLINHRIQAFIMALVWGFGAPLQVNAREKFNLFIY
jgi:Dynein heavy chain AAA lid domain